ncbi:hypothetical protein ACEQ8H_004801 [Pleosporales sp. CAS-2024a]
MLLLSSSVAAAPSDLVAAAQCGTVNGVCNKNGCNGKNDPRGGPGVCGTGQYAGCPCTSICGPVNGKCNLNGCNGSYDASVGQSF